MSKGAVRRLRAGDGVGEKLLDSGNSHASHPNNTDGWGRSPLGTEVIARLHPIRCREERQGND